MKCNECNAMQCNAMQRKTTPVKRRGLPAQGATEEQVKADTDLERFALALHTNPKRPRGRASLMLRVRATGKRKPPP